MRKPKIAFLAPCVGVGGGDLAMMQVARHLRGIEPTGIVVTGELRPEQYARAAREVPGVPIHGLRFSKQHATFAGPQWHEGLRGATKAACEEADILLTWGTPRLDDIAGELDIPVVSLTQNEDATTAQVIALTAPDCHYHLACGSGAKGIYPDGLRDQVKVIYNPVDPARVTPTMPGVSLRKLFDIPAEAKVVSFIGRLVPEKHPEKLIAALLELPGWYGVFQGEGPMAEELRMMARQTRGRVRFLPWDAHVGDTLAVSDAFLLVSDFEGFPLAVAEAWLAGVPTVLSWMSFLRHLMADHHLSFGHQVEVGHHAGVIAQKLEEAVHPENPHTELTRRFAWENLSITAIAKQYEIFLLECLHDFQVRKSLPSVEVF